MKPSPELAALLSTLLREGHADYHSVGTDEFTGVYHIGTPDGYVPDAFVALVEAARLHCAGDHEGSLRLQKYAAKVTQAAIDSIAKGRAQAEAEYERALRAWTRHHQSDGHSPR